MCGRYAIAVTKDVLEKTFKAKMKGSFKPRYNAAPTQMLPIILNENPKEIIKAKWGLIPSWAKDEKIGNKLINARSETVVEKPAFKSSFNKRRCLVLTTGFFEWKKIKSEKQPYYITVKDSEPFAMAGIWSKWKDKSKTIRSFTILTGKPNSLASKIHDRMPIILKKENYSKWLNTPETAKKVITIFPASKMNSFPVSKSVNIPANDKPEVIKKV
ncbi:SOS response-associated peptidase [Nanoarchaeota archaeon]